jgi:hypothetical protein
VSADQLCEAAKGGMKENVTQFIKYVFIILCDSDGVLTTIFFLRHHRSGVDVNAAGSDGRTALHWSVDRTKFAVVKVRCRWLLFALC